MYLIGKLVQALLAVGDCLLALGYSSKANGLYMEDELEQNHALWC